MQKYSRTGEPEILQETHGVCTLRSNHAARISSTFRGYGILAIGSNLEGACLISIWALPCKNPLLSRISNNKLRSVHGETSASSLDIFLSHHTIATRDIIQPTGKHHRAKDLAPLALPSLKPKVLHPTQL